MLRLHIQLHILDNSLHLELAGAERTSQSAVCQLCLGQSWGTSLTGLTLTAAGSVPWEEILQNPAVWSVVACHAMSDLARHIHDD